MTLVTIWSIVMESNCGTSNSISEVSCYEAWHRFLECYDLSNHVEVIDQIVDEHNRRLSWLAKLLDLWFFWPKNRSILERLLGSTGTNSWELSKLCTHRFSAKKGHVCQLSFSPEVTYRWSLTSLPEWTWAMQGGRCWHPTLPLNTEIGRSEHVYQIVFNFESPTI